MISVVLWILTEDGTFLFKDIETAISNNDNFINLTFNIYFGRNQLEFLDQYFVSSRKCNISNYVVDSYS